MAPIPHRPRVITYYQTHHDASGNPISVLPLISGGRTSVTHVMLAAIHINDDPSAMTLNNHPPHHPRFDTLWSELRALQGAGIKVMGMLGGAAAGTYARLGADEATFERYYAPLRDLVRQRGLDGLDLDVEEKMSLAAVVRLIDRIRSDFGPAFTISLAPVAAALLDPRANLSGFDYEALEVMRGRDIAFYNAQFYCGWGSAEDSVMYQYILAKGWPAEKVVVGLVTNPANGAGFVEWAKLAPVLMGLAGGVTGFGGVMGWEYFNSLPGGRERPWEWAGMMGGILGVTRAVANSAAGAASGVDERMADGDSKDESAPVPAPFTYMSDGDDDNGEDK